MLYLAPLQGFTDFIYRKAFAETFGGIDAFFIPYITFKGGEILKKYEKEILPENNLQVPVIPQVLVSNGQEIIKLSNMLAALGYTKINLNLGCPYPMVTNRRKGAGLLPFPEEVRKIMEHFFTHSNLGLSVKMRAGLHHPEESRAIIEVLNDFSISEIIFHPRVAKQLYKGEIQKQVFEETCKQSHIPLTYNGDIFSMTDFHQKEKDFPRIKGWMLGRGILMNPCIVYEIRNIPLSPEDKRKKLSAFHAQIFNAYSENIDNQGNVLTKMKQFWGYFCYSFSSPQKTFKAIKKANSINIYLAETNRIFNKS